MERNRQERHLGLVVITGVLAALWISLLLVLAHTLLFLVMVVSSLLVGLVLSFTAHPRIFSPNALVVTGSVLVFIAPYWFLIAGGPVFFVALSLFLLGLMGWAWGAGRVIKMGGLSGNC